ncbi:hypothetical protein G6F65_017099 [Rhizopus arrhizus]|nr:hypothetical protein G6F65_017099 [Rhizopus arrhizus]
MLATAQVDEDLVADRFDAFDARVERMRIVGGRRLQVLGAHAHRDRLLQPRRLDRGLAQRRAPFAVNHGHATGIALQRATQHVHRRAAKEAGHEQIGRAVVQRHRRVDLLDDAVLQHHDALAQGHRFDLVMGHVDHGGAQLAVQLRDLGPHTVAQLGIQVRQRLVEQEHRRLAHQRAAQRNTLALAAGHRLGQLVHHLGQAQRLRRLGDAPVDRRLVMAAQLQAEGQVLGHGHVRVQRVALEHHRDVAILRRHVVDHAIADGQRAAADLFQPSHHPQQGRLATAGRADQHHQLAIGDLEAGVLHRDLAVVIDLAHTLQLHFCHIT